MNRRGWGWPMAAAFGLGLGLAYAWAGAPQELSNATPASLRPDFKDKFRVTIAAAYAASGDLERARARLALLEDGDEVQALSAQAQQVAAAGESSGAAQDLARLASDLGAGVSSIPTATASSPNHSTAIASAEASSNPPAAAAKESSTPGQVAASPGVLISSTPQPRPSPSTAFEVLERREACNPALQEGLLQITVLDDQAAPFAGIEITITWDQGEDRFFTGLQPAISDGYADYTMTAGISYALRIGGMGTAVSSVTAPTCQRADGTRYAGGLELTLRPR